MKISEYAVKNYQFTLVVFLAALAMGIYSLVNIPKGEDPKFEAPTFFIVSIYPGTTAADMEQLVVNPLENRFKKLDTRRVFTTIGDGISFTVVEYKFGESVNDKFQEVTREVNSARTELPSDIYDIQIRKIQASDVSIYQYALVSENASFGDLQKQADDLSDRLKKITSVKDVKIWGIPKHNVRIDLQLDKIAQLKIPITRIVGALQSENASIPGGSIALGTKKFNIRTDGSFKSLEDVKNTIINSNGTKIIYLKDVADVALGYEDETHICKNNGFRCAFVTVTQKDGQNILAVKDKIEPIVNDFKANLPKNIDFKLVFDQVESVGNRLMRFAKDFGLAILLVLITLLPLGFRAAFVVMVSIPLSLAIGLILLDLFGFNINQLSIVGMIVSLGILVDDSIVVVENIERYLREGWSPRKAAIEATKQIGLAVVGCTAALIFAFLPLLFLPEGSGAFIRSLPAAVVCTVFASMLVSLTIVPFLSSRILVAHENPHGNFFLRGLKRLISGSYSVALIKALKYPKTTLLISTTIFVLSCLLIPKLGFSLFPKSEKPMFMIDIDLPEGTNIAETAKLAKVVEAELKRQSLVVNFSTNVGKGNPPIYYNSLQKNESESLSQIFVQLEKDTKPKEKTALIDELRLKFAKVPNAEIRVNDFEQGPPIEAPLSYRIIGDDLDTLRALSYQLEDMLKSTEGTLYVINPLQYQPTDLKVNINKDKAGMLGIATVDIDRTVRLGVAGVKVGSFRTEKGDDYNMTLSIPKVGRNQNIDFFDKLYVNNVLGNAYPLSQVADIEFVTSQTQIRHYQYNRFFAISAFVKTGFFADGVNKVIEAKLANFKFPKGYTYIVAGEKENKERSFGGLGMILMITAFGFVGILVLEFRTFKSTMIVLSVIPLGVIGALLMLYCTGNPLSFTGAIGFIALIGIEVKNSILLVDFTNQLRKEGYALDEAIKEAGEVRFVPIVLTSLTAIGGLLPLVIEYSPLYSPLALVLIGGLISSTLLSRLVTPIMYKLLPPNVAEVED